MKSGAARDHFVNYYVIIIIIRFMGQELTGQILGYNEGIFVIKMREREIR